MLRDFPWFLGCLFAHVVVLVLALRPRAHKRNLSCNSKLTSLSILFTLTQRGAILANELKNNSCKLARWTAQALLGGIDEMKLGYVSRVNTKDPYSHVVLGTQSYNPHTFANQIALNQNNMWGVVKMLAELMLEQPEGKYVLMKDPNKPVVRLYSVPQDTFDEEDDEENEA